MSYNWAWRWTRLRWSERIDDSKVVVHHHLGRKADDIARVTSVIRLVR